MPVHFESRRGDTTVRVEGGTASVDGATVRIRLTALPAAGAELVVDLPDLATGAALRTAIEAARPLYGVGAHGDGRGAAVSVWRDGARWCATRVDDLTLECDGASPGEVLAALAARLAAERASVCAGCRQPVLTVGHDDGCSRRRRRRA